jgi:DNA methylase
MPRDDTALKTHDLARDPDGRMYRLDNMSAGGASPARIFNGKIIEPPIGNHWRFSQENIDKLLAEGRIVFTRNGTPRYKCYLDETPGMTVQDVWDDINPVNSGVREALGYPTQKPIELLERVIAASSNPGDLVLDPFCGCGTAVAAAQKLGRRWVGIDITHLSIALQKYRLEGCARDQVRSVVLGCSVTWLETGRATWLAVAGYRPRRRYIEDQRSYSAYQATRGTKQARVRVNEDRCRSKTITTTRNLN